MAGFSPDYSRLKLPPRPRTPGFYGGFARLRWPLSGYLDQRRIDPRSPERRVEGARRCGTIAAQQRFDEAEQVVRSAPDGLGAAQMQTGPYQDFGDVADMDV